MRHVLLTLTGVLLKDQSPRALELGSRAASTFVDIICQRQDRLKVKPALQGLAHFLLKDVISIPRLLELHADVLSSSAVKSSVNSLQTIMTAFLAWIVHHDTSLSAGHLIKNYLTKVRQLSRSEPFVGVDMTLALWIEPVVITLHQWPDRIQEFKTHVFPHCFLPNLDEYVRFLSYLRFSHHIEIRGSTPEQLQVYNNHKTTVEKYEEFRILIAAIEAGKELGIIKDNGRYLS